MRRAFWVALASTSLLVAAVGAALPETSGSQEGAATRFGEEVVAPESR